MRANTIIIAITCALAISCSVKEEDFAFPASGDAVFYAVNGDNHKSKTVLNSEDGTIKWSRGDKINLFYGAGSFEFTSSSIISSAETVFRGSLDGIEYTDDGEFWAVYPFGEANTFDGASVTVSLPSTQTATPGTFANKLFISLAKTKDNTLHFYNVCGGVCFSVTEDNIKTVVFTSNNGEPIAGTAKVAFNSAGVPVIEEIISGTSEITLNAPDKETFVKGQMYYVVCLPATLANGYTMRLFRNDGVFSEKKYSKSITVKRSVWGVLNNVDQSLEYEVPKNEIRYTTTDGEMLNTIPSAWEFFDDNYWQDEDDDDDDSILATVVSHQYSNGVGIITYSGPIVRAEMPINDISDQTADRHRLLSLVLPESVNMLYFGYCNNLSKVTILGQLRQTIGSNPFIGCPKLKEFYGPNAYNNEWLVVNKTAVSYAACYLTPAINKRDNITAIGDYCFACTDITGAYFMGVKTIGSRAFYKCRDLSWVHLDDVETINPEAFMYCSSLETIELPNTLTRIYDQVFYGCSALKKLQLPTSLTYLGSEFIADSGLKSIVVPASVKTLGEYCFDRCPSLESVTLCSITPPVISGENIYMFWYCFPIVYVPKQSLQTYLDYRRWYLDSSQIKPMETIVFMDPKVKSICINNWDKNGDGELSYTESESVTSIGNVFKNTDIVSFPEFSAFTGITTIGNNAFYYCTSLKEIAIPNSVRTIGESAFSSTSSLTDVLFSSNLQTIKQYAFSYSDLVNVTSLPASVQTIEANAFNGSNLRSLRIPDSVDTIGSSAFGNCKNLLYLYLPSSLKIINSSLFLNSGVTTITIPASVTQIMAGGLECTSLKTVNCLPATPPSAEYYSGSGWGIFGSKNVVNASDLIIYVTDTEAYKAASGWSPYKDRIRYKKL